MGFFTMVENVLLHKYFFTRIKYCRLKWLVSPYILTTFPSLSFHSLQLSAEHSQLEWNSL